MQDHALQYIFFTARRERFKRATFPTEVSLPFHAVPPNYYFACPRYSQPAIAIQRRCSGRLGEAVLSLFSRSLLLPRGINGTERGKIEMLRRRGGRNSERGRTGRRVGGNERGKNRKDKSETERGQLGKERKRGTTAD